MNLQLKGHLVIAAALGVHASGPLHGKPRACLGSALLKLLLSPQLVDDAFGGQSLSSCRRQLQAIIPILGFAHPPAGLDAAGCLKRPHATLLQLLLVRPFVFDLQLQSVALLLSLLGAPTLRFENSAIQLQ